MNQDQSAPETQLPEGVVFNAYPDSIGHNLADTVQMLKRAEFKDVFSLFYILPTIFHSDLDRGFSIIDYDINEELVSDKDLTELQAEGINFKFDLVLNHLSVGSPQFQDMLQNGDQSKYKHFFIDWNEFWGADGEMGPNGYVIPKAEYLNKLFMRKPGLPILKVRFPDGTERPYWNTFYQEVNYPDIKASELLEVFGTDKMNPHEADEIADRVNTELQAKQNIKELVLNGYTQFQDEVIAFVESKRTYLGQMDLNAKSELVWDFYDKSFEKLSRYGAKLIRLDAFAYLHKEVGESNFFNEPGTWDYLSRLKQLAHKHGLVLLPEIHSVYGTHLHEKVSAEGFPIYDFYFPGLVIHALDNGSSKHLKRWISELMKKNIKTINMLGCHDGIPVLDLKGVQNNGEAEEGLLSDTQLDTIIESIMERGGRVKNLYGPDGKKISYYQVNATFFSALGENEQKLLLARAIQLFMPGIPQVWYLDLFAGKNDYAAADRGGTGGHKEINRTTLSNADIEDGLKKTVVLEQLELIRLRNSSPAFNGSLNVADTDEHELEMTWKNEGYTATLKADLRTQTFTINHTDGEGKEQELSYK